MLCWGAPGDVLLGDGWRAYVAGAVGAGNVSGEGF